MLSPRETDRLKRHYKSMTARQFFAEGRRLTRRSQQLLDRNRWDEHEKNEQKLNVWMMTREQMQMGLQEEDPRDTKFKKDERVRHLDRSGRIEHVHRDGSYTIRYANGNRDRYVLQQDIEKISTLSTSSHRFHLNDRVLANIRGGHRDYPGRIQRIHRDGTYSIRYDDGDFETHVPSSRIIHRRTHSPLSSRSNSVSSSPPSSPQIRTPRRRSSTQRIRTPVASPITSHRSAPRVRRQQKGSCDVM